MNDHPLSAESPKLRVLLVDDEPWMLRIMKAALPGVEVVTCSSGEEALRLLHHHEFDVVCSDLVMPSVRGEVVLHAAAEAREETGLLLVTGLADVGGLEGDGFEVMQKPFDPMRFADVVAALGERSRARFTEVDRVERSPGSGASEGGASHDPTPPRTRLHERARAVRAPQGGAR